MGSISSRPYTLSSIAQTGDLFTNFAPFVSAINNNGTVAFQAATSNGGSGIFKGDGTSTSSIVNSLHGEFREFSSHPDLADDGSCCFYATHRSGRRGVFLARNGQVDSIADSFGPLGPTMDHSGLIAFRAEATSGSDGIFIWNQGSAKEIARTGDMFIAFQGLPVIQKHGHVAFRADLRAGGQGIFVSDGARITPIVQTGTDFDSLGAFPIINEDGTVAFCATLRAGGSGLFIDSRRTIRMLLHSGDAFESFRGVLINNSGDTVFYATPIGGTLGVFTGSDPRRDCLLAIGAPLAGSTVSGFALNPVSINDTGQLAIRVQLADLRQLILRAEPGLKK